MSLAIEYYNYFEVSNSYRTLTCMSEDIPEKTLISKAERKRLKREKETPEERAIRQEKQRERQRSLRQAQSDQKRGKFREYQRILQASLRENETEVETADRLDYKRIHQASLRETETDVETADHLDYKRIHQASLREYETEVETADHLDYKRIHQASLRETETEVETADRLDYKRIHQASLREYETVVETADRLDYKRIHQASLREYETKTERMIRLKSMTSTYEKKKTLQSKRYLNIAKSYNSSGVSDTLIDEQSVDNMTYHCSYCDAKFWEGEKLSTSTKQISKFSLCCGEGKVVLPPLDNLPELLDHLLTSTDTRGKYFRNQIRAYNSSLAFCSLGANINKELECILSVFRV